MKIKDLKPDSTFDVIRFRVISSGSAESFRSKGKSRRKREVLIGDETGKAVFTLWGEDTSLEVKAGKVYEIYEGWCSSYLGKLQVSLGKEGYLMEIEEGDDDIPSTRKLMEM